MKILLLFISFAFITANSLGQQFWGIDFDTPINLERVLKDTISNPNCNWQIGKPNKTIFNSSYSVPNSIVTDTINSVPPNDTSSFYLIHQRPFYGDSIHAFGLEFFYKLDGDSTDFGLIEISPDSGITWINMLTQDTTYQFSWALPKPTLTGSTNGWEHFSVYMSPWASCSDTFPVYMTSDSILFRFTYITNADSSAHDGWIIDDIYIVDAPSPFDGLNEIHSSDLIAIYPNPVSQKLRIKRNKNITKCSIQIYSYTGELVLSHKNLVDDTIDISFLADGSYLLKYVDDNSYSINKFTVRH